jgi:hypothetical protein
MDASRRQHMGSDQYDQGCQRDSAGTDPVGERRDIQLNALARISFTLAIERQMVSEFAGQHHGQQFGPSPAARYRVEGRGWLGDRLTGPAAPLLADGLDHLPPPRHDLQGLGDALAELRELAATAWASRGARYHHPFSGQMGGKRAAYGAPTSKSTDIILFSSLNLCGILAGRGFQLLEFKLHLIQQFAAALRRCAEAILTQLGDQKLQVSHHRLGAASAGLCLTPR